MYSDDSFVTRSCFRFIRTTILHVPLGRNVNMQHKGDEVASCTEHSSANHTPFLEQSIIFNNLSSTGSSELPIKFALFHFLHMHAACSTPIVALGLVPPTRCATVQDCKPQSALLPCPTESPYQQCVLLQPTNQLTALFIGNTKCAACRTEQYNSRYK